MVYFSFFLFFCLFIVNIRAKTLEQGECKWIVLLKQYNIDELHNHLINNIANIKSSQYGKYMTQEEIINKISPLKAIREKIITFINNNLDNNWNFLDFGDHISFYSSSPCSDTIKNIFNKNLLSSAISQHIEDFYNEQYTLDSNHNTVPTKYKHKVQGQISGSCLSL